MSKPSKPEGELHRAGLIQIIPCKLRVVLQPHVETALEEIAKSEDIVPSYATRLFRLTVLAPISSVPR